MKFSEKMKLRIKQYSAQIDNLWAEQRYARAIIRFVVPCIIIGAILFLLIEGFIAIVNYLRVHYVQLIFAALVIWAFAGWWDNHKAKQMELRQKEQQEKDRQVYMSQLEYNSTKESTYIEQGKLLFAVARELGGIGIMPPLRLSNIYSPSRTISKMNGAVRLCQFLLQKDMENVDIELIRHTLQTKIDQRLVAGEFPGIPEKFIYNGHVYSGFLVDSVRDSEGYVEVYTVLTNEAYCRYKQNRDLNNDMFVSPIDRRDIDY